MKFSATVFVLAILLTLIYIVIFSLVYPLVEISAGITGLFGVLGLFTSLVVAQLLKKWID
jgi:hypothetical protein